MAEESFQRPGTNTPTSSQPSSESPSPSKRVRGVTYDYWAKGSPKKTKLQFVNKPVNVRRIMDLRSDIICEDTIHVRVEAKRLLQVKVPALKFVVTDASGRLEYIVCNDDAITINDQIEVGRSYYITGFKCVTFTSKYPVCSSVPIQGLVTQKTSIVQTTTEAEFYVASSSNVKLNEVVNLPKNSCIDVLVIVAENPGRKQANNGSYFTNAVVTDDTKTTMRLSLWDELTEKLGVAEKIVVRVQRAVVTEYNNVSYLQTNYFSKLTAFLLQAWFDEAEEQRLNATEDDDDN